MWRSSKEGKEEDKDVDQRKDEERIHLDGDTEGKNTTDEGNGGIMRDNVETRSVHLQHLFRDEFGAQNISEESDVVADDGVEKKFPLSLGKDLRVVKTETRKVFILVEGPKGTRIHHRSQYRSSSCFIYPHHPFRSLLHHTRDMTLGLSAL